MTSHHALPEQRVTLITLGVRDLGRSRSFYRALGWEPAQEQEGVSFYQMHGAALALFGLADLADDMDRPVEELGTGAVTLAQNFATEEAVDAAWARAMQAGGKALKTPQATAWGGLFGLLRGSRRACLGTGDEPVLAARARWQPDPARGLT